MKDLVEKLKQQLDQMISSSCLVMTPQNSRPEIDNNDLLKTLLLAGLKNEWETSYLSMIWAQSETDPALAMMYSRLAGDEAKHFLWIQELIQARGVSIPSLEQLNERSPLFLRLLEFKNSFDRMVAGPFLREALAVERNKIFLNFCSSINASDVLEVYQKIQGDEIYHHQMGLDILTTNLKSHQLLERGHEILNSVMKTIDDIQEMLVMKKKLMAVPGC